MKIEVLYPSLANLYGEAVEVKFLKQCLPDSEWIDTEVNDTPAFADGDVDMIYMGPMSEKSQEIVASRLMPYKDRLRELIDNGTVFLIIGNALEIFGEYIENEDGSKIECLGIFPTHAKRKMMNRYNSLYLGSFGDIKIVGFKAQFSHSYGDNDQFGLFDTLKGDGICPGNRFEGIHKNNFFATYLLGPLLIMNPDFAKYILALLGIKDAVLPAEKSIYEAYNKRLSEFEDPNIKLT